MRPPAATIADRCGGSATFFSAAAAATGATPAARATARAAAPLRGVVHARERQVNDQRHVHRRVTDDGALRGRREDLEHAHVPRRAPAEREAPIGAHVRGLRRDQRIGRGKHRPAVGAKPREQLALRARDVGQRVQALEVRGADVGDHADVRARDLRQVGDFPVSTHRHLKHPRCFIPGRGQDGQRQADVGVEASRGAANGAQRAQRGGAQLLGRGLAVRSGHADDQPLEFGARRARHVAHRAPRIVGGDDRDAVAAGGDAARAGHDDAGRAGGRGLGREVETVDALAREREEELAGRDARGCRGSRPRSAFRASPPG